ncbi:MAG: DUF6396 domain-containing protein [Pseudomonadota bacterium]
MPTHRDKEAYQLYMRARKLWRSKIAWQLTRQETLTILHDVEHAAQAGDWGARALMAHFYLYGLGPLDSNHVLDPAPDKAIELVRKAIAAGQAWGYYDLGVAYEQGHGGVEYDADMAWAYYRKAAELGSPEAQMALASVYKRAKRSDAAEAMIICAHMQGHGPAAYKLGMRAENYKRFRTAIAFYQDGIKFGHKDSADSLMLIFDSNVWNRQTRADQDEYRRLELKPDAERSRRYDQIGDALAINPDLRLSRLDKVLPLPPAEVPPWNGIEDAIEPEPSGPPRY